MNTKWEEFHKAISGKKLICYGAGVNASLMLMDDRFQQYISMVQDVIDANSEKQGKQINGKTKQFIIKGLDLLERIGKDDVVIVTLSDYVEVGRMLDKKKIKWVSWTIALTSFSFEYLEKTLNPNKKNIFLLNTPDYINLGDHAIAVAEDIYIRENFGEYYELGSHSCHEEALKTLKKYVKKEDVLLFQGGGNLGSLWRVSEETLRNVLKIFPENNVIVFPQSVFYGSSNEEQKYFQISQQVYNEHKNLTICVRDKRSYDFIKASYNCDCLLLPDMVLTIEYKNAEERAGVGLLLRDDKERNVSSELHTNIQEVLKELKERVVTLTHHPIGAIGNRSDKIRNILKQYASCKLIITDRLHGMIFSAITRTPCIAFDNSYKKVSGVYDKWLTKYAYIVCKDNFTKEELKKTIEVLMEMDDLKYNANDFKDYFKELTNKIKVVLKDKI